MRRVISGLLLIGALGLWIVPGCSDEPSDVGQTCSRRSDCEEMCKAVCDTSPCTASSTSFHGECSSTAQCSFELDEQGSLTPTVCP